LALSSHKPRKVPGGLAALFLSLIAVVLLSVWSYEGGSAPGSSGILHNLRSATSLLTTPLDHLASFIGAPGKAVGNALTNLSASSESLLELQNQNDELVATVARLEEYRLENERLSKLLELADAYSLEAVGARILKPASDSWNQSLTISKGASDGIAVGMPVMSPNGLIGQVEQTGPFTSVVRLLTDLDSGVAVFLQANRSEGVVSGSVEGLLYLRYISLDVNVVPGDVVVTSGAGGVYPKGIVVGEVTSASYAPSDVYQTVVVKPLARVSRYEEILVLTGRQTEVIPKQEAATNDLEADEGHQSGETTEDAKAAETETTGVAETTTAPAATGVSFAAKAFARASAFAQRAVASPVPPVAVAARMNG
jgi:rod shape-determining protein MreC